MYLASIFQISQLRQELNINAITFRSCRSLGIVRPSAVNIARLRRGAATIDYVGLALIIFG